jgi:hypothetical protein
LNLGFSLKHLRKFADRIFAELTAQILNFPTKNIRPVVIRTGRKHRLAIKVLDTFDPRRTRWRAQFEVQEEAGYPALKGFTDRSVARGEAHDFEVGSTASARRFLARIADFVDEGTVAVWIDGARVRPKIRRRS